MSILRPNSDLTEDIKLRVSGLVRGGFVPLNTISRCILFIINITQSISNLSEVFGRTGF